MLLSLAAAAKRGKCTPSKIKGLFLTFLPFGGERFAGWRTCN